MALTEQQQRLYARSGHGFDRKLPGVDVSRLTEDQYEELVNKTLGDFLKEQGVPDAEKAKSDKQSIDTIEALLGFIAYRYGDKVLYDFVVDSIYDRKIGDIVVDKEQILAGFKREKEEMYKDYKDEENYGQKGEKFLKATKYDPERDGAEEDYFYRYWRSPLTKMFTYRGIDPTTTEGEKDAHEMLEALFGSTAREYTIDELSQKTPEFLVEKRDEVEEERQEKIRMADLEKERLKDLPFHETLSSALGMTFTDTKDPVKMAKEAVLNAAACERLKECMGTKEAPDEKVFAETILLSPRQIEFQAPKLIEGLQERNDEAYLTANPDVTFSRFLKDRREDTSALLPDGQSVAQKAMQRVLKTDNAVDQQTVSDNMDTKCSELRANASKILAAVQKRKSRKRRVVASVVTSLLILGAFLGTELYKATVRGFEKLSRKDPAAEEAKREVKQEAPQAVATDTNTTDAAVAETNAVPEAVAPVKTPMVVKGNRPVLGRWHGWENDLCTIPDKGAFQRLFVGEFNDIMRRIRDNGVPFGQQFDPAKTSRSVSRAHRRIRPESVNGEEAAPFFIDRGTKDYDEMMTDILNYHMNIGEALGGLPVAAERLPDAQVAAMEAIGPSMGWSVAQQLARQKQDPQAEQAFQTIVKGAQTLIEQQKADTNDVETVFWATMAATKEYRQSHPDNNYLLLTADRAVRQIAGIEVAKTQEYAQLSQKDRQEAAAYIAKADAETRKEYSYTYNFDGLDEEPEEKKSYPWGYIALAVALTAWLGSAYWKERGKVVR